jgi:hypothetical protein
LKEELHIIFSDLLTKTGYLAIYGLIDTAYQKGKKEGIMIEHDRMITKILTTKKGYGNYVDEACKVCNQKIRKELLDAIHHRLCITKNYVGADTQLVLVSIQDIKKIIQELKESDVI